MKRALHAVLLSTVLVAPAVAQDSVRVVKGLKFVGNRSIDTEVLSAAISTTNSNWFARTPPFRWIGLGEKREFDELEFKRDVLRLILLYRQSGFMEVKIDTVVTRKPKEVAIQFLITEGEPVRVTTFTITGIDTLPKPREITEDLALRVGAPFNRFLFQTSADTIARRLRNRGYPSVEVLRSFDVDKDARTAAVSLEVVPGKQGIIGPVTVEGSAGLDTSRVRKLLLLESGQLYKEDRLFDSQRKLYSTDLFRFATVTIDSTRFQPGDTVIPILTRVAEGRRYKVRSQVGYGTDDCFRIGAGFTDRNIFRSGKLFDLSARVSKIGVGDPLNFGLENNICSGLKEDSIGSSLVNYNVTALVREPRFLGSPRLVGNFSVFGERRSEVNVYRVEDIGGALNVVRETPLHNVITVGYRLTFGKTVASDATLCAFFNACTPADRNEISQQRRAGVVSGRIAWPRSNSPLDPTRGSLISLLGNLSAKFTGSSEQEQFASLVADAAWYRPLSSEVTLSWRLRAGALVSPEIPFDSGPVRFTPPEARFYAGGPNDVRGYSPNEMGPVVYIVTRDSLPPAALDSVNKGQIPVHFSATGGNTLAVANVELRVPSPIWSRHMRFAFFVDGGLLYQRGETKFSPTLVRVTPGGGIRVQTPLGPLRLDLAYNGYANTPGALYLERSDGTLVFAQSDYQQPGKVGWKLHFAIGQPF
ncbi:MAG TPA: BamA/TamA family outer membrane protein [Gemmatimonadales bacterium]|nr:BamA/TamA family outer membrane protein [Gemmatimonadales bacterium]